MVSRKLIFVTGNANKLREVRSIMSNNFPLELININLDLPELQGEIKEVSIKKCQEAARRLKTPVLVEDTALCYNALHGLPGPYIKWFSEKLKPEGLWKLLCGWENKSAEAVCTLAYCTGDCTNVILFQSKIKGQIVEPQGSRSLGWYCIFQPDGSNKTYAELTRDQNNKISHRYEALEELKKHFISQLK